MFSLSSCRTRVFEANEDTVKKSISVNGIYWSRIHLRKNTPYRHKETPVFKKHWFHRNVPIVHYIPQVSLENKLFREACLQCRATIPFKLLSNSLIGKKVKFYLNSITVKSHFCILRLACTPILSPSTNYNRDGKNWGSQSLQPLGDHHYEPPKLTRLESIIYILAKNELNTFKLSCYKIVLACKLRTTILKMQNSSTYGVHLSFFKI